MRSLMGTWALYGCSPIFLPWLGATHGVRRGKFLPDRINTTDLSDAGDSVSVAGGPANFWEQADIDSLSPELSKDS